MRDTATSLSANYKGKKMEMAGSMMEVGGLMMEVGG